MAVIAIHQMCSGVDPQANLATMLDAIGEAARQKAEFYFAPEMSLLLDRNRQRASSHISAERLNKWLTALQEAAVTHSIWCHLGSAPVMHEDGSGRFANRSYVIDPGGQIIAHYDKIHLFDVDLSTGESWRESNAYRGGDAPVMVETGALGRIGLTICYDLRFPDLFSHYARQQVDMLAVPAAFTVPTGEAHWHVMLRARAIEAEAFVVAAAQCGQHEDGRRTYGHSLVVDPWGKVLLDMGSDEGLGFAEIELTRIDEVRSQIPVHANRRDIPAA